MTYANICYKDAWQLHLKIKMWIKLKCHMWAWLNKLIFKTFLKASIDCTERTWSGRMFQARGSATTNAWSWSPNDRRVLGTFKVNESADRKPFLWPIEDVSQTLLARYDGAFLCMGRKMIVAEFVLDVLGYRNQWWPHSSDVTCSNFPLPVTSRIAEFRTDWSRRMLHEGSPAKTTMQ